MAHDDAPLCLVIVGAGSGNMLPAPEFAGWRIAVVEAGRFGGTCLHRRSEMFAHVAANMYTNYVQTKPDLPAAPGLEGWSPRS
jgi:hypothetical protein